MNLGVRPLYHQAPAVRKIMASGPDVRDGRFHEREFTKWPKLTNIRTAP